MSSNGVMRIPQRPVQREVTVKDRWQVILDQERDRHADYMSADFRTLDAEALVGMSKCREWIGFAKKMIAAMSIIAIMVGMIPGDASARVYEPCQAMAQTFRDHPQMDDAFWDIHMNQIGCDHETLARDTNPCSRIAYRYAKAILRKTGGSFWTTQAYDPIAWVADHTIGRTVKSGTCKQFEDGSYGTR